MSFCCSSRATDRASRQHLSRASLTSAQHAHSVEPRNSTHRLAGSLTPVPCGAGRLETDPPPFGGRHSSGIHEPTATLTSGISSRTRWLCRWCARVSSRTRHQWLLGREGRAEPEGEPVHAASVLTEPLDAVLACALPCVPRAAQAACHFLLRAKKFLARILAPLAHLCGMLPGALRGGRTRRLVGGGGSSARAAASERLGALPWRR